MKRSSPGRWRAASIGISLACLAAATLLTSGSTRADDAPKTALASAADQMARLVQDRRMDDLAKLSLPAGDASAQLSTWKSDYVTMMAKAEELRAKHYDEEVKQARDLMAHDKLSEAVDHTRRAYTLTNDRDGFLELDWVKSVTTRTAANAADLEKSGQWLESLDLFSDLNSLYEIDTRYKADALRLTRRLRLIAMYTPKTLIEMRKALNAKLEKEKPTTAPATAPATMVAATTTAPAADPDEMLERSLVRWQDQVEKIDLNMARKAIDESRRDWVEPTNYETLLRGGVEALRLFLSTPSLAQEFPALGKETAKADFNMALDAALSQINPMRTMDSDTMHQILDDLLAANNKSVQLPQEVFLMEFTDGALEKLDQFTAVIWPHALAEFDKTTQGTFGGVGVQISQEPSGELKVISPLEDTPAYAAGIQAGDVITGVDGKTTAGMSIDSAVHQIMGDPDTMVTLSIRREGVDKPMQFPLKRAVIHVSSVKGFKRDPADHTKWQFMIDPQSKIGYVRITGFQQDTTAELKAAIDSLTKQDCRGLVLDLRFNPGGLLRAAIDISGMFVNTESEPIPTIVSTKGNMTPRQRAQARGTPYVSPSLPVVVLINQYSASASEIFSGAIKDLHRGTIVGQRSYGKGSVQDVMPLEEKNGDPVAEIKLTKQYYYLPEGESLHRRDGSKTWGVEPDVVVEMTPQQIVALDDARREADVIARNGGTAPATQPATQPSTVPQRATEPLLDTPLETGLLLLRLQLLQGKA